MPNQTEVKAMEVAIRYLQAQGYDVENVSRKRSHNGYDLLVRKAGNTLKIEVKGTTRRWGIPDPYVTEFDPQKQLIADFLFVVYLIEGEAPKICEIPRAALKPEYVVPKQGYRISSKFKKERVLRPFLKSI
jgi:hypothetical protein